MEFVTTFCWLMMAGAVEFVFQGVGEARLVANSRVKPVALVGQVKRTFVPAEVMVNCGGTIGSERPKRVPYP